jgi:hypothetical protein
VLLPFNLLVFMVRVLLLITRSLSKDEFSLHRLLVSLKLHGVSRKNLALRSQKGILPVNNTLARTDLQKTNKS